MPFAFGAPVTALPQGLATEIKLSEVVVVSLE
jgi:hypothetical protein